MSAPGASIPSLFRDIAVRYAQRIAISAASVEWTYAELDQRSNALAAQILERLGEKSEPVVLLMEHDAPLIAGILAVLKTGKLYLALDPSHPAPRLAAMLADSQARLVVTDPANVALADSLAGTELQVLEANANLAAVPAQPRLSEVAPEAGAWLMYTSGSTGQPKGVWQNHRSIAQHADVYRDLIRITPEDRLSLLTSCSLSASGTPLFAALLNGATLCPFLVRTQGVERLAVWLRERGITVYHSVPTVFRQLARVAAGRETFSNLRLVRLGGEPVLRSDVELFRQLCPERCRLMHALSSTETGLISALLIDGQTPLPVGRVPVGRTVPGVEVLLVDEAGKPIQPGDVGRITVRSERLCQGYWRQPEATAQKFHVNPDDPRQRIFHSNDLGRFLPDGSLEHLGRSDTVVKIRGLRVDLTEVEGALNTTGRVADAAVLAQEDEAGERRLVAYFVPQAGQETDAQGLRRALAHLPEHLIPTGFVPLKQLPQTAGGKIDRRALPPWAPLAADAGPDHLAPRKGIEQGLAEMWSRLFGMASVNRRADFFELGGTSLQSVQLLTFIQQRFNVSLSPSVLLERSTLESLAELVGDRALQTGSAPLVVLRRATTGRPLFLVHAGEGDVALYGQLARHLPERPLYGFQCPGLDGEGEPLLGIRKLARRYLVEVLARDPDGPYLLGGTRMGAWVAFEMAQQLTRAGKTVKLVALFDFYPSRSPRLIDPLAAGLAGLRDRIRVKLWTLRRFLGRQHKARWLASYRHFVANRNCHARHEYRLSFYPGTITLFVTADRMCERQQLLRYAREVRIVPIAGPRSGLLIAPAVADVARELQKCLVEAESVTPPCGGSPGPA